MGHLEDCRSWIYTSCNSGGIAPTTCREAPPKSPPKPPPRAPREPTTPVKVVEAVPPEPAPVEDSIIPGLAREEHIETVKLEEEKKHPESIVVAEQKSDFDKRNEAMEGMLSTQPIRDEIARTAAAQEKVHGRLFVKAWQDDRKIKLEELVKRQARIDRTRIEEMYTAGATAVPGDYGDEMEDYGVDEELVGEEDKTGGTGGTGNTGGTGSTGSTGSTGYTGSTGATGGIGSSSETGLEVEGETAAETGPESPSQKRRDIANLDDHAHWRVWERSLDPDDSADQAIHAQEANARSGHESADDFLKRWGQAVWKDKNGVRYTSEDLAEKSQDWQRRLDYMKRHNIDYN